MSHKRHGQLVPPPEWHVHLRRFLKRVFWKRERKAARELVDPRRLDHDVSRSKPDDD